MYRAYYGLPRIAQNLFLTGYAIIRHLTYRKNIYFYKYSIGVKRKSRTELDVGLARSLERILKKTVNCEVYKTMRYNNELTPFENLKKYPLVDKSFVKSNSTGLRNKKYFGIKYSFSTSGTTGTPLSSIESSSSTAMEYFLVQRMRQNSGIRQGAKYSSFIGRKVISPRKSPKKYYRMNYFDKQQIFSYWHFSSKTSRKYLLQLIKYSPDFITGYPSFIYEIAKAFEVSDLTPPKIKGIYTSSEKLLLVQRQAIEKVFSCKVYDYYGQTEHVLSLSQCPEGNYHHEEELSYLEFIGDKIYATSLVNTASFFIRYEITDIISKSRLEGACRCGRNETVFNQPDGRVEDVLVAKGGKVFGRLDHLFKSGHGIYEAQIIQISQEEILVKIVPERKLSIDKDKLKREIEDWLGDSFEITINTVEQIERESNGKFKMVKKLDN